MRNADQLSRVRTCADVSGRDASITTDGPDNKGLRFSIEVPACSDLVVRLTAGDLRLYSKGAL